MEDIIISLIPDTTDALDRVVGASEKQFLVLGERLGSIHEKTCELTEQTMASTTAVQGKNGDRLDRIAAMAKQDIDGLESMQETIRENIRIFPKALKNLSDLAPFLYKIDTIARQINNIAVAFMVETARLGNKDRNFSVLADEIKDLSQKIFNISGQIKSESQDVEKNFKASKSLVAKELDHLSGLTQQGVLSMECTMDSIREMAALSLTSLESAAAVSKNVNDQVGQIIFSMQMQDNISQRISHINKGLSDIHTLLFSDQAIGSFDYTPDQRKHLAWSIYRIQISQLSTVVADLNKACQTNQAAFEQISEQINQLKQMLEDTRGKKNQTKIFKDMSAGMGQLETIRAQGLAVLGRFKQIADNSVKAGTMLCGQVTQVQQISEDAHIKALNAIIASQKLTKDNAVYKVLAIELKERAIQISELTENTEKAIEQITRTTGQINTEAAYGPDKKEAGGKDRPGDQLNRLCQTMAGQIEAVVAGCAELNRSVEETTMEIDAVSGLAGQLDGILASLAPMEEYFSALGEPARDLLLNDPYFHERYTMDTERAVHNDALINENDFNLSIQNESLQDQDDNIEFF